MIAFLLVNEGIVPYYINPRQEGFENFSTNFYTALKSAFGIIPAENMKGVFKYGRDFRSWMGCDCCDRDS